MLVTATYLQNRSPTKALEGNTPYEAIYGLKPKIGHLRVFGCTAYSHISQDKRQKLDTKTRKCIFLGYSSNRKGYQLYDQSKIVTHDHRKAIYLDETGMRLIMVRRDIRQKETELLVRCYLVHNLSLFVFQMLGGTVAKNVICFIWDF